MSEEIKTENQEVDKFGFVIRDAMTHRKVKSTNGGDTSYNGFDNAFVLSQDGKVYEIDCGWWSKNEDGDCKALEAREVSRKGKYIIQFADGRYMRY